MKQVSFATARLALREVAPGDVEAFFRLDRDPEVMRYIGDGSVGTRVTAAATVARDAGFDGKWAIHPAQVPPLVELFTPAPEEVEHARAVLAALDSAGQGAIAVDGEMLDEAHRRAAESTLARAGL